jgi:hypothetical protein
MLTSHPTKRAKPFWNEPCSWIINVLLRLDPLLDRNLITADESVTLVESPPNSALDGLVKTIVFGKAAGYSGNVINISHRGQLRINLPSPL